LFQICNAEVLDDSITEDNFIDVEILKLLDLEVVFFLDFCENGGLIKVVEILGYPFS
jgi:hypothetical protein